MQAFLSNTKYLVLIGVLALLAAAVATFGWGVVQTVNTILLMVQNLDQTSVITLALMQTVDVFLIATSLLVFALGLYELFIGDLRLPEWLVFHNLHDLKGALSSVIVLVLAVKFVEKLVESKDPLSVLITAVSITLVSGVLIVFANWHGHK